MAIKKNLIFCAVRRVLFGVFLTAVSLFPPAGTLDFWQAWAIIILDSTVSALWIIYFHKHAPEHIERRLLKKEELTEQKWIRRVGRILWIAALATAGLDHRFGWSASFLRPVPLWLECLSFLMLAAAYAFVMEVFKTNEFAASVIRTESGQTVIDTGPYAIVRHPMYFGGSVANVFVPLALGSFVAWPVSMLAVVPIIFRLLNEEKFLRQNLAGYTEYCQKTRRRLVPFVW